MPTNPDDDGAQLAAWSAARDEAAFRRLCDHHAALVAASCRRLGSPDADEAAQAVFLILARRAGSLTGTGLAGWLHGTVRRVVAHQRRAVARRRRHEQEAAVEFDRQQSAVAPEPLWTDARQHLDEALASLSAGRREALLRFHLQGKSQAEVAAELGCSVDAVKTRVHEGLERLRSFFARRGVALGATVIATGLASECAAAEPALAAACAQSVLVPASAPGATALATGVTTVMLIKNTALVAAGVILVGSCLSAALLVSAETPPPPPVPGPAPVAIVAPSDPSANAALDWWRAIDALPKEGEAIWKLADVASCPLPDPTADAMFQRSCRSLDLLALGAANSYCAWGVDTSQEGAGALLPYVGKMRSLVRLVILRARWHAARGEQAEAVDDLLTVLRTARLFPGRQPLLIDYLVGLSCERLAIDAAGRIAPQLDTTQRQRLLAALPGLPAGTTAAEAMGAELGMVRCEIGRLLAMPLEQRVQALANLTGKSGVLDTIAVAAQATDASLKSCLEAFPIEIARWQALLRRPPGERLRKEAMYTTGERAPHPLIDMLAPAWGMIASNEVRGLLLREQLLAALDYLGRGEPALADHLDVLTAKPFRFEKTASGFRLLADIPDLKQGATLVIGESPAAAAAAAAAPAAPAAPATPATPATPADF